MMSGSWVQMFPGAGAAALLTPTSLPAIRRGAAECVSWFNFFDVTGWLRLLLRLLQPLPDFFEPAHEEIRDASGPVGRNVEEVIGLPGIAELEHAHDIRDARRALCGHVGVPKPSPTRDPHGSAQATGADPGCLAPQGSPDDLALCTTMQPMTKALTGVALPFEFEEEFITGLKSIFEEKIVFNQLLGLKITSVRADRVTARIDMRPALVGHYAYNRVHGGVISAGLDAMGGLAVMAAIGARHMDEAPQQRLTGRPHPLPKSLDPPLCLRQLLRQPSWSWHPWTLRPRSGQKRALRRPRASLLNLRVQQRPRRRSCSPLRSPWL